jgi:hypothetical protein
MSTQPLRSNSDRTVLGLEALAASPRTPKPLGRVALGVANARRAVSDWSETNVRPIGQDTLAKSIAADERATQALVDQNQQLGEQLHVTTPVTERPANPAELPPTPPATPSS